MDNLPNFNSLVTWATWEVIQGITKGESLQQTMFRVVEYARRWKPEDYKPD